MPHSNTAALSSRRSSSIHNSMTNRAAVTMLAALGALFLSAWPAKAQDATPGQGATWEIWTYSGKLLPTGAQRDAIQRGNMMAAQLTRVVHPMLAFTATVGWAGTRDITSAGDPKLDVFTYDTGAEVRLPRWISTGVVSFTPIAGLGVGARSYNYRKLDVDATHNLAAYGSAGGEIAVPRVRIRLEARDYITGFKPLGGMGEADSRNDVVVLLGVRFPK